MSDSSRFSQLGWSSFFQEQLDIEGEGGYPAKVVGIRQSIYLVKDMSGEERRVKLAGKLFHSKELLIPAVGDWVVLRDTLIHKVLERKSILFRKAAGTRGGRGRGRSMQEQVMAANIDLVFIVCGLDRDFNLRRIERYLTLVYSCSLDPVIILTKADLHENPDQCIQEVESIALAVPVHLVAKDDDFGLEQVAALLTEGKTATLIGSSGAGKSTLINRLYGADIRDTKTVGDRVGKGKHTTTTRDLIQLPCGGMVIDNPGIREVGLLYDDENGEDAAFPEIEALAELCRFGDCTHTHEPGCKVLEGVATGRIDQSRLENYRKIKSESQYFRQVEAQGAARTEKKRWKPVAQKIKSIKKRKKK